MAILLEIVTPERLAYSDEVDSAVLPGSEGGDGCPAAPCAARVDARDRGTPDPKGWDRGVVRDRRRFVQVRPDKVVVMAETADMASEIDLEKAQEARREAERALEVGLPRSRRHGRSAARPAAGAPADPCRRATPPGGPAAPRVTSGGRKTVPLGVRPGNRSSRNSSLIEGGKPLSGSVAISGAKNAALKDCLLRPR